MSTSVRNNQAPAGWPAVAGHDSEGVQKLYALVLPPLLRDRIGAHARAVFPAECCGLLEGHKEGDVAQTFATHPVRNLAQEPDRFELDPAEHIRILRALRGTGREIIGCYHSHPNGRAELSRHDRENIGEDEFLWLIAGVGDGGVTAWSCHAPAGGVWREIGLMTEAPPCA